MNELDLNEKGEVWERIYNDVCRVLQQFGTENHFGKGEYLVVEENYGWREVHIEVHQLTMLAPEIVDGLRALLKDDPDWTISVAVHVPGTKPGWPPMGLKIRQHEIIDGLQRQYLPEPYRSFHYDASRPGTEDD